MSEKERTEESAETAAATGAETAAEETREAAQETTQEATQNTESETTLAEDPAEALRGELAAEKDRNMRLLADFDNFRRRVTREKNETYQRATEAAIVEFLPVLDNFDRAIAREDLGLSRRLSAVGRPRQTRRRSHGNVACRIP